MKKILVLVLALLSLFSIAHAENAVDLATLTTEELVELRNAVNAELASRDFKEKEVTVPPGRYTVGVDIPVGVLQSMAKKYNFELTTLISGDEPHMRHYFVTRKGKGLSIERRRDYKYQSLAYGFADSHPKTPVPFTSTHIRARSSTTLLRGP